MNINQSDSATSSINNHLNVDAESWLILLHKSCRIPVVQIYKIQDMKTIYQQKVSRPVRP